MSTNKFIFTREYNYNQNFANWIRRDLLAKTT